MMSWPALLVGRTLAAGHRWAIPLVAGWALAAWDVFLDPQMVAAGRWQWRHPAPSLPGVADVPLTNFAGWFAVAVLVMVLLDAAVPRRAGDGIGDDALPYALYLWTFVSCVLANLVFFGRPAVAVAGGVAMGAVAVPLAVKLWRRG
jgi:putative membrane protein